MSGQYSITTEPGPLLKIAITGRLTVEQVAQMADEARQAAAASGQAIYVLVDMRAMKPFPAEARKHILSLLRDENLARAAFYGAPVLIRMLFNYVVHTAQSNKQTQMFRSEEPARAWLLPQEARHR